MRMSYGRADLIERDLPGLSAHCAFPAENPHILQSAVLANTVSECFRGVECVQAAIGIAEGKRLDVFVMVNPDLRTPGDDLFGRRDCFNERFRLIRMRLVFVCLPREAARSMARSPALAFLWERTADTALAG